jgi:hypothetical protein
MSDSSNKQDVSSENPESNISFLNKQHLQYYNNFLKQLNTTFPTLNIVSDTSVDTTTYMNRCLSFVESLNNEEHFINFTKSKIKVFSHKDADTKLISESLLTSKYPLKNFLNNQTELVKNVIWKHLYNIYMMTELMKPIHEQNMERIKMLSSLVYSEVDTTSTDSVIRDKLNELFNNDLNSETSNMINDIVKEFETQILNKSNDNSTPGFNNIMGISQIISSKYADKIKSGEIQLEKLLSVVLKKMPGMEKLVDQFGGMENLTKMMNGSFGQTAGETESKEKVVIDENFSTANIVVPNNTTTELSLPSSVNIGNVLKIADKFGVLGESKNNSQNNNMPNNLQNNLLEGLDIGNLLSKNMSGKKPNMGTLNKMMGLLNKLNNAKNDDNNNIKNEMDSFLQNDLGIDTAKLHEQINKSHKLQ